MNRQTNWDDTIVALATPPGIGAIGVIRLSGKKTFYITNELFPFKDLLQQPSHTIHVGYLKEENKILDEVVLSLFKGPRSYTGEDVIEISCHGSPFIHQQIIEACIKKGARLAKPGEFTQRAFLNGKLDLAQAEAVADLIASNTAASHKTALNTIRGGFSLKLKELRERLVRFSALIELELDFSQEDVEFADRKQFYELIYEMQQTTTQLISSFRLGNVIKNGVSVAIIGKPNAGKSTLLNMLLNEDRAIVSEIPGTTRDTIEEVININGILFRLIDTAGIREHTSDSIENAGVERSLEKMKEADLVLHLFDVSDQQSAVRSLMSDIAKHQLNYLLVGNKIDQLGEEEAKEKFNDLDAVVFISAKQGLHTELLKQRMVDTVMQGEVQAENTIITNARHYHALKEVDRSLTDIENGLNNKLTGDLLALDIRRCLYYIGEITGEVSNEDLLDYIFSKFCIGK
jgi:tRNA modification GTPase